MIELAYEQMYLKTTLEKEWKKLSNVSYLITIYVRMIQVEEEEK